MPNLLVFQSGGPTAAINASLAGVIATALASREFESILGSRFGVEGILRNAVVDLTSLSPERLDRLARTPSAALGTSRHRPSEEEITRIVDTCRELGVGAIVAIGGNDTADTALRLVSAARGAGGIPRVVAVPKTIDNDLPETDHSPGYGSIARFTALSVRDSLLDTAAMARIYPLKIVEVMGRNAGWIAASASLLFGASGPRPMLCFPERPYRDADELASRVARRLEVDGYALLVVPETMRWADGRPSGGETSVWTDTFGHTYFPGAGGALVHELGSRLGIRARFDKPGTIARMAMHAASEVDLREAREVGAAAVRLVLDGHTGLMATIVRTAYDPYEVRYGSVELERVANVERRLPDEMISASGDDVTEAFTRYATPLIGAPIEEYESLTGLPQV